MNNKTTKDLLDILKTKGDKISKAKRVRSLLEKQKGLMRKKQSLTDFEEPVLDLHRRSGQIETYEKATAGKFIFEHSDGKPRFIELRPIDQETRDYAGKKVRWYSAHEDYPFAGWQKPFVDAQTVELAVEKIRSTDLKYQERIEDLKRKSKLTWVWIILGLALSAGIIMFAWSTWIAPAQISKAQQLAKLNQTIIPSVSAIFIFLRGKIGSRLFKS